MYVVSVDVDISSSATILYAEITPPTLRALAIPTPPEIIRAPDDVEDESVVSWT